MPIAAPVTNPAASVPSGALATPPPAYDPQNAQPYQQAQLPDVDQASQPIAAALPPEQPVQDLGAATHGGAAAYIGDQLLRGVMQGVALHQMNSAVKLHRQSTGLQQNLDAASKDLYSLAKSGADPKSPEYQAATDRVNSAYSSMMDFYGQHVPGTTIDKKTGQPKPNKKSLMDRLKGNDPAEVSGAVYEGMLKAGPPVFHQVQQFQTPQYRQFVAGQGAAVQAQTADVTAKAQTDAATNALKQERMTLAAKPNQTEADKLRITQLDDALQGINKGQFRPMGAPYQDSQSKAWVQRMYDGSSGRQWEVPVPNYTPPAPKPGAAPKVGTFGDFMAAGYGSHPTAAQYIAGRKLWQQATSSMTMGTHDITVPQLDGSLKLVQVQTTSQKVVPGAGAAATTRQDQTGAGVASPPPPTTTGTGEPTHRVTAPTATPTDNGRPKPGDIVGGRQTASEATARKALDSAQNALIIGQRNMQNPTPVGDAGMLTSWLKGHVNRVTQTEIKTFNNLGGAEMRLEGGIAHIVSGKMTDQQRQWFMQALRDQYKAAQTITHSYDRPGSGGGPASSPPSADTDMPPQAVIDAMHDGQFAHGSNGATWQKVNGHLQAVTQ